MPIHYYMIVLAVALALPLQSAYAACQCYQETATSPEFGYLELFAVPCTSTPSGYGWVKVPTDQTSPNPDMHLALRSSRDLSGMVLLYTGEWSPGVPRVALTHCGCCCVAQQPALKFDFTPPDWDRTEKLCPATVGGSGEGAFCAAARREAQSQAEATAWSGCAAPACGGGTPRGTFTWGTCWRDTYTYPYPWMVDVTYTYTCEKTYNLCR